MLVSPIYQLPRTKTDRYFREELARNAGPLALRVR